MGLQLVEAKQSNSCLFGLNSITTSTELSVLFHQSPELMLLFKSRGSMAQMNKLEENQKEDVLLIQRTVVVVCHLISVGQEKNPNKLEMGWAEGQGEV